MVIASTNPKGETAPKKSSVLICTFWFPPSPRVGCRRWVKFAKYLQRAGWDVHVLAAENLDDQDSPWQVDANELHRVTRIPYRLSKPYYLRKPVKGLIILTKILWKLSYWHHCVQGMFARTHPQDPSIALASRFRREAHRIIQREGIGLLIASGGPWRYVYELSRLKGRFNFRYIVDFRDYWTDGPWFQRLSRRLKRHEEFMESRLTQTADVILSPTQRILTRLQSRIDKETTVLFREIRHAYDPDEFCININRAELSEPIRFIYFGTLYEGLESTIEVLLQWFSYLADSYGIEVTLDVYTTDCFYEDVAQGYLGGSRIRFFAPLTPTELMSKMTKEYHYALYMRNLDDDNANFFSTKFADIMGARLPIVYIGPEGLVSQFIHVQDCGFVLSMTDVHHNLAVAADFSKRAATVYDAMTLREGDGWDYVRRTSELMNLLEEQLNALRA